MVTTLYKIPCTLVKGDKIISFKVMQKSLLFALCTFKVEINIFGKMSVFQHKKFQLLLMAMLI